MRAEIAAEKPSPYGPPLGNGETPDGTLHFNGFPMPRLFRESLSTMDLHGLQFPGVPRVLQLVSHETEAFARIRAGLQARSGFQFMHTPAAHDWNQVDNFGGILLPQALIQAAVNWLDMEART